VREKSQPRRAPASALRHLERRARTVQAARAGPRRPVSGRSWWPRRGGRIAGQAGQ